MIGQRIQGGGVLSEREREMFEAVVGATNRFPVEQMDTFPQGGTNPDIMKDPVPMPQATPFQLDAEKLNQLRGSGQITEREGNRLEDELNRSYQVDDRMEQMTSEQLQAALDSGRIMADAPAPRMMPDTPSPQMAPAPQGNVMSLQEAIEAGFVTPTRPQPRPTAPMTSMRPQTRRTR